MTNAYCPYTPPKMTSFKVNGPQFIHIGITICKCIFTLVVCLDGVDLSSWIWI